MNMTATQIKYLMALAAGEGEKKSLSDVARSFHVNRSTVSRVLAVCVKENLLDSGFSITDYGSSFIERMNYNYEKMAFRKQKPPKTRFRFWQTAPNRQENCWYREAICAKPAITLARKDTSLFCGGINLIVTSPEEIIKLHSPFTKEENEVRCSILWQTKHLNTRQFCPYIREKRSCG